MNLLLFLALLASPVWCIDFTQTVFGRSNVEGVPAAFGDFNSDELTDIFMLRDDFHTIQVGHPSCITNTLLCVLIAPLSLDMSTS